MQSVIHVLVLAPSAARRAEAERALRDRGFAATGVATADALPGVGEFQILIEDGGEDWRISERGRGSEPLPGVRKTHVCSLAALLDVVARLASKGRSEGERTARATQLPRHDGPVGPTKLLLVDDSEVTLDLTQAALKTAGFDVRIAVATAEALAIADSWRPDVAVVDLRRPDATDSPLCAALKRRGVGLTLVASSRTEPELVRATREASADGYVSKARGVRAFVARIQELVSRALAAGPGVPSATRLG
jgi:CheY-like chemotaxis protein